MLGGRDVSTTMTASELSDYMARATTIAKLLGVMGGDEDSAPDTCSWCADLRRRGVAGPCPNHEEETP